MRAALLQLSSTDDPVENLRTTSAMIDRAVEDGAGFVLTPEVTNCVSTSRTHQMNVLQHEADDHTLTGLRDLAARRGIWLSIGSLALKTDDPDGRFANRSFLISPDGGIAARYDKIHMFDVQVSETETYRESAGYRPGDQAVVADTPFARIGMSICYDVRFAYLYRALAQAGAEVLLVPSAFSPVTGAAHWQALLQARAIETGAWVLAAAQCGQHQIRQGKARRTYGHSMAVSPWGVVMAEAGEEPDIVFVDLDHEAVDKARGQVPALTHDRKFKGP
ncbi:carbon-nitrogen hydrolase family protein [Marinovum sp. 2_MG-2023]|uniref:carbon-nitrogen hydrolase family protein n=1 Tax=unclassified Marinovum TaxID=2647166 RepID=UPI0026E15398|nr:MULTISPECIES: carbon-nitrogen hydrolase family protein [unclassified Marinovum]MDO6730571.1 carbon-nitrogen hydrolase family protein [Marinovum sp. 2_MG-2023]MDO6778721.1 carbon-nitrogen hydrolase family protein [Marinovum sp. 1_MG-2023]